MKNFKEKLRNDFNRAALQYDHAAKIQKIIAVETAARAKEVLNAPKIILDLGCGTGFVSEALSATNTAIIACDIAEKMVARTCSKNKAFRGVAADLENVPFQENSVDVIVSSLALQWNKDLTKIWSEWMRVLKPNGVITASLFTENSLAELKELNTKNKKLLTLETLPSQEEIRRSLGKLEKNSSIEIKHYNETYADLFSLLKNLKAIGARTKTKTPHLISKSVLKKMNEEGGEIRVTWEVAFVVIKNSLAPSP